MEAPTARADAAGEVCRGIGAERHDEGDEHHPIAVEVGAGDPRTHAQDCQGDDAGEEQAESSDLGDDGASAVADGAAMAEAAAELLLERQEEAGSEGEGGEPQRRERRELLGASDGVLADGEEQVRRHAGDEQRGSDRDRALGERSPQRGSSGDRLRFGHGLQNLPTVRVSRGAVQDGAACNS